MMCVKGFVAANPGRIATDSFADLSFVLSHSGISFTWDECWLPGQIALESSIDRG